MRQVRRAKPNDKIELAKPKPRPASVVANRRPALPPSPSPVADAPRPTDQAGVFKADGVSNERLKRLAAGRPPVEKTFDLHGVTRDEALTLLENGFAQACSDGRRVLCIIHGRGLHSPGRPVLKQAVYHWLREGPYAGAVLAVTPQPGSGGGACLVLLRRRP